MMSYPPSVGAPGNSEASTFSPHENMGQNGHFSPGVGRGLGPEATASTTRPAPATLDSVDNKHLLRDCCGGVSTARKTWQAVLRRVALRTSLARVAFLTYKCLLSGGRARSESVSSSWAMVGWALSFRLAILTLDACHIQTWWVGRNLSCMMWSKAKLEGGNPFRLAC
jgi:hypothetical protein